VPPDQVPQFGTFWVGGAGAAGTAAPLPCQPIDPSLPIYAIAEGQFLVADTGGEPAAGSPTAAALTAQANALVNLITQIQTATARQRMRAMGMDVPSPGGDGSGDGGGDYSPAYSGVTINTNLLSLEMVAVTNQTASLVIHPPWDVTNEVYDLLYCTNLLPPIAWQWLLRSYPDQTNLLVPNATDAQGFYRLSSANDLIATDSRGTNFWLMFPNFFYNPPIGLSLYISSPVATTGTITFSGIMSNSTVAFVTNCGDMALNGTYTLTNVPAQAKLDWQQNLQFDAADTGYVMGTNWLAADTSGSYLGLIEYDSGTGDSLLAYYKFGSNPNGTTNDWMVDQDAEPQPPATSCQQFPVSQSFTVPAGGGVTNIAIDSGLMTQAYDVVGSNSFQVTASLPVSVYGMDNAPATSATFTGYPTTLLGTNYCLMARAAGIYDGRSEFAMVATTDNTTVTITPSSTANLPNHTNPYSTSLMQGQTYQIQSQSETDDVTGTLIASDKPVAVFAGASLAFVPDSSTP